MKRPLMVLIGLTLVGPGVALAQQEQGIPGSYNREYSFEDVDTNSDGQISVDEAKANPGFVDEAIHSLFSQAHGSGVTSDTWDQPLSKEEWEGLTSH